MKWSDKRFMMWFRSFSTVSLFTLRAAGGSPKGATRDERGTEWDEWRPKERLDVAAVRDRRDEGVRDAVTRERRKRDRGTETQWREWGEGRWQGHRPYGARSGSDERWSVRSLSHPFTILLSIYHLITLYHHYFTEIIRW
jgi:hypothetical protein